MRRKLEASLLTDGLKILEIVKQNWKMFFKRGNFCVNDFCEIIFEEHYSLATWIGQIHNYKGKTCRFCGDGWCKQRINCSGGTLSHKFHHFVWWWILCVILPKLNLRDRSSAALPGPDQKRLCSYGNSRSTENSESGRGWLDSHTRSKAQG